MHLPQLIAPQLPKLIAFAEFGDSLWFLPGNRNKERM